MKTLSLLFSSWLLVLLGAVTIPFSTAFALNIYDADYLGPAEAGGSLTDGSLLCRVLPFVLLGVLGVLSGVHLREVSLWVGGGVRREA